MLLEVGTVIAPGGGAVRRGMKEASRILVPFRFLIGAHHLTQLAQLYTRDVCMLHSEQEGGWDGGKAATFAKTWK